jgi:tRNA (guanine-N7-)-methyltransferase
VSKGKLVKFAEMETFTNVLQPRFDEAFKKEYPLKGNWKSTVFKNNNPITLELGCGKGEYTIGLAKRFADRNFIGIDIKGARIWKGAKEAFEAKIPNVFFLRTRIELLNSFFDQNEIEEIWFTFPDPQLKKPLKRLTSSRFLNLYRNIIGQSAWINLKTDNFVLFEYTRQLAAFNELEIAIATEDVYASGMADDILTIQTFYEKEWLSQGLKSHYLRFKLEHEKVIKELPE